MTDTVALRQPWYRGLSRHQWNILLAANLGWLFDGFELYALIGHKMKPAQVPTSQTEMSHHDQQI